MSNIFEAVKNLAAAVGDVGFASVDLGTSGVEVMAELLLADEQARRTSTLTVDYDGPRVRETVSGTVGKLRVTLATTRKATREDLLEYAESMRQDLGVGGALATVVPMRSGS